MPFDTVRQKIQDFDPLRLVKFYVELPVKCKNMSSTEQEAGIEIETAIHSISMMYENENTE